MNIFILIISSFSLVYTLETSIYDDSKRIITWFKTRKLPIFYNTFVVICFMVLLTKLLHNELAFAYLLLSVIFIILSLVNFQMLFYRNELLKPTDLKLIKESKDVSEHLEIKTPNILPRNIIINLVFFILLFSFSINLSIAYTLAFLSVFCLSLQDDITFEKYLRLKTDKYSDFNDYKTNGFLVTFLAKLKTLTLEKPLGYKKGISNEVLKDVETSSPTKTPNIIIVMNESFFDINTVENLELSRNPLENFSKLQAEFSNGNVISPVIGGGTCQPEYEMLTGKSVFFTGKFKIAFLEFFKKGKKNGIAKVLKDLSYSTTFIHPYKKSFYNREKVYTSLEFDKILDIESFTNSYKPRSFISDEDCYSKSIEEFEKRDKNKPFFNVIVTMQNHPGYLDGKQYDEHDIVVLNENIVDDEKIMLENYANLLKESDNAFNDYINYFKDKEDTVIMMFGDHQPTEKIGFSTLPYRSSLELSKTPFIIWNNFNLDVYNYKDINPCFLSPILLNSLDIKTDKYFNYMYENLFTIKAFNTEFVIDGNNFYIDRKKADKKILDKLNEMELVQFDLLK